MFVEEDLASPQPTTRGECLKGLAKCNSRIWSLIVGIETCAEY